MDAYTFIFSILKDLPGVRIENKGNGKLLINSRFFLENQPGKFTIKLTLIDNEGNFIETIHDLPTYEAIKLIEIYVKPRNTGKVPGMATSKPD